MVNALKTVDGIGLGRPITEQVTLPRDILKGHTTGARDQALDMNDFGLTSVLSMAQMRQIGDDHMPIDMSKAENVEAFGRDVKAWMEELKEDREKREKFGNVPVRSVKAIAYAGGLAPRL
jgi:hypothetical protein